MRIEGESKLGPSLGESDNQLGQTFMPDFLASIVVFGILVSIFLASWNSVLDTRTAFETEKQMRFRAKHTTAFLVSTPGYPRNWSHDPQKLRIPGFAEPDHLLQGEKLHAFRNLTYQEQREALLARNFYMTVRNSTSVLKLRGKRLEFGKNYSDAETVIPFTRSVEVNLSGEIQTAKLRYIVWK